uniref:Uncharacterized protein n=1 Tax=Caenorhabditis japonica TaxID=281687 RepID=A0A8R1ENH0_CAEJA
MASKNAGCDSYSVKGSARFVKVPIANLISQSLHMLQGLAQHFGFDELKQMANECDLPRIQKQSKTVEKECKSHISAIQSELTELEKHLSSAECIVSSAQNFVDRRVEDARLGPDSQCQTCVFTKKKP